SASRSSACRDPSDGIRTWAPLLTRSRDVEPSRQRPSPKCVTFIRLHALDESLDEQPAQWAEHVLPVRCQPDLAAETDGVGARPEIFAAVVKGADARAGNDGQRDSRIT